MASNTKKIFEAPRFTVMLSMEEYQKHCLNIISCYSSGTNSKIAVVAQIILSYSSGGANV